ncbi:MAG: hypothetical protein ACXWBO_07640 [Ilumatobacteraceae bacterium]
MIRPRRFITSSILFIGLATVAIAWPSRTPVVRASQASWLTIPAGLPLFTLTEVTPGDTGSATFAVTNPQSFPVEFSIAVTSLTNDDNGCNEPEQAIGDTTCGPGGGELQSNLRLMLTATGSTDRPIAEDTVDEWSRRPAVDTRVLSGYEYRTYRVDYELPIGASNVTQSDRVAFQFEMRIDQALDSVASDAPPQPVVIAATPPLPRTGSNAGSMVILGLGAVLVGVGMNTMSIRRRRSR